MDRINTIEEIKDAGCRAAEHYFEFCVREDFLYSYHGRLSLLVGPLEFFGAGDTALVFRNAFILRFNELKLERWPRSR